MDAIASQITSLTIVDSIVYSDAVHRKHQSSSSLAFVQGIHRGEFPAQMASYAENVSIWWRHHVTRLYRECNARLMYKVTVKQICKCQQKYSVDNVMFMWYRGDVLNKTLHHRDLEKYIKSNPIYCCLIIKYLKSLKYNVLSIFRERMIYPLKSAFVWAWLNLNPSMEK